ncbi:MAG: amino acid ABC transporter substrate-binding protein [Prochloraceae cyanobacterium]|nr:amino acid ABC transporter substrate-binding protein [Prochloraceae cyanobacterium]
MNAQSLVDNTLVQIELPGPQGDDSMVVGFEPTWDIYPDAQGDLHQSDFVLGYQDFLGAKSVFNTPETQDMHKMRTNKYWHNIEYQKGWQMALEKISITSPKKTEAFSQKNLKKFDWKRWFLRLGAVGVVGAIAFNLTGCYPVTSKVSSSDRATSSNTSNSNSILDKVKQRGQLICGVNGKLPGFSFVTESGTYSGMDTDFCRAVAAALFDDPSFVEFRNISSQQRFTVLQTRAVDLLARNTTNTMSRETSVGVEFAPTIFYDGQGMMVPANSGIRSLEDLDLKTVCVTAGTTTELNLADAMSKLGIEYTPVVIDDTDTLYGSYAQGRCDAVTSDRTQLLARRSTLPNPQKHIILDEVMSKEPLAPATIGGDRQWSNAVKWVIYALITAEEYGINSKNIDTYRNSDAPKIRRFLGAEGTLGSDAGLPNDFAARIIKHVGNYGEIYDRNIGKPLGLERGQNELANKGGLLYSPPFR